VAEPSISSEFAVSRRYLGSIFFKSSKCIYLPF
jgi:hypothetical protein